MKESIRKMFEEVNKGAVRVEPAKGSVYRGPRGKAWEYTVKVPLKDQKVRRAERKERPMEWVFPDDPWTYPERRG